jgi:hypothetical protein
MAVPDGGDLNLLGETSLRFVLAAWLHPALRTVTLSGRVGICFGLPETS